MSRHYVSLKKSLALLAMGGSTFAFYFGAGPSGSCQRNADYVTFFQSSGSAAIAVATDGAAAAAGTSRDFDAVITDPFTRLLQSFFSNGVAQVYPRGQDGAAIVRE